MIKLNFEGGGKYSFYSAAFLLLSLHLCHAESLTLDMGESGNVSSRIIHFLFLITIMSLAPSILIMVTSFTRLIIVFSFLRSAIGLQQSPPNNVLTSLALFLTAFIMAPTFETAYNQGLKPYMEDKITDEQAFTLTSAPFQKFMLRETREKDIDLFRQIANLPRFNSPTDIPLKILIPAFMISELKRAFEIGFLLFLPFMIIDLVVSSVLMSMGMMMLPPMMVSLPFKLIFFVLIDGWHLIVGSLVKGFS